MVKTIIYKSEIRDDHPVPAGILSGQHGLKEGAKAEV